MNFENKNYDVDKEKRSYYVDSPLKSIELKTWPDILLAICAVPFIIAFSAMFVDSTKTFAVSVTILVDGLLSFGLGGKIAYYRFRDSEIGGNMNAWFSGWRHSILADTLAILGVLLISLGVYQLYSL